MRSAALIFGVLVLPALAAASLVDVSPASIVRPHSHASGGCVAHVTYVTPVFSPVSGGGSLTVLGHGFELCGAAGVTIGNASAAGFRLVSDTRIVATVPPGVGGLSDEPLAAGRTGLAVGVAFRPRGSAPFTLAYQQPFTYYVPPRPRCSTAVRSISTRVSPVRGGVSAVVSGVGFRSCAGVLSVKLGPLACLDFSVDSDTSLTLPSLPAAPKALFGLPLVVTFFDGSSAQLDDAVSYSDFLSSAQVSPYGLRLRLGFDTPVAEPSDDCTELFSPETLSLLGAQPVCTWRSRQSLVVTLGVGASIAVGGIVSLRPAVRPAPRLEPLPHPPAIGWSLQLAVPEPAVAPTIVWSVSGAVPQPAAGAGPASYLASLCDDLLIDATFSAGDAGRAFDAAWSHSLQPATSAVAAGMVFRVPRDALRSVSSARWIDVSLRLRNWLGGMAVQSLRVYVDPKQHRNYPRVRLPVMHTAVPGADVWISADVEPSGCSSRAASRPSVFWRPVGDGSFELDNVNSPWLRVPASSLGQSGPVRFALMFNAPKGKTVTPVVIAETTIVPTSHADADGRESLLRVDGGDARSVPRAAGSFSLRLASSSSAAGGGLVSAARGESPLPKDEGADLFEWHCLAADGTVSCDDSIIALPATTAGTPPDITVDTSNGENGLVPGDYTFVVQRRRKAAGADTVALASVRVLVQPGPGPAILLSSSVDPDSVNAAEPVVLDGHLSSAAAHAVSWLWSTDSIELQPLLSTSNGSSVALPPGSLRPGADYSVRLEATVAGVTAFAELRLRTASLPVGGALHVEQRQPGSSLFALEAPGWRSEAAALAYEFSAWSLDETGARGGRVFHSIVSSPAVPAAALPDGELVVGVTVASASASVAAADLLVTVKGGSLLSTVTLRRAARAAPEYAAIPAEKESSSPDIWLSSMPGFAVVFVLAAAVLIVRQNLLKTRPKSPVANRKQSWQPVVPEFAEPQPSSWEQFRSEEATRAEQEAAATKIQAAARGFLTRLRLLRFAQAFSEREWTDESPTVVSPPGVESAKDTAVLDLSASGQHLVNLSVEGADEITYLLQSIDELLSEESETEL